MGRYGISKEVRPVTLLNQSPFYPLSIHSGIYEFITFLDLSTYASQANY